MKRMLASLLLMTVTSCTYSTEYGECYGLLSENKKDPDLIYEFDGGNVFWGLIFSETLVVPLIVVLDALKCPVRHKYREPEEIEI